MKRKGIYLADVRYPDAQPPANRKKKNPAERVVRGGLVDGDLYSTARRAAQQMSPERPRGPTWGKSESHAIAARDDGEAPPTGSFDLAAKAIRRAKR